MLSFVKKFLKLEAASGIMLMGVALCAVFAANSPFAGTYEAFVHWPLGGVPLSHSINDGLMSIFFLVVGMEIKREITGGELSSLSQALMPCIAALAGVMVPALIYLYFNGSLASARGWAIPSATDIAFSLGVLALFGSRVAPSLTVFLMSVAVIDDLAAVIIIALFYTEQLSAEALLVAALCMAALFGCNRGGVKHVAVYLLIGAALWVAVLKSGVHPTVAGVLLGAFIPGRTGERLIHALHPWVAFGVVPLFAFVNAGVPLSGIGMDGLLQPVPLGIALGLLFGKPIGIFGASWLMVRLRIAKLPAQSGWLEFLAVSMLAGIGFTMSLFIGFLAFGDSQPLVRLGVLTGSLLSAVAGGLVMALAIARKKVKIST